jgi:cytochrome b561
MSTNPPEWRGFTRKLENAVPTPDPLHALAPLPDNARYGNPAIAFHWTAFLLVLVVGTLGLLHDSWPDDASQTRWVNVHALLGLLLWSLTLARLVFRLRHPPPALPTGTGEFSRRLSAPVHLGLYALLLGTPILGIITFIWHGRVFDFGLFQVDFHVPRNRAVFHPTEDWHGNLAYALFGLAGLHALAALWHQFVRHDGLIGRMWPAPRSRG